MVIGSSRPVIASKVVTRYTAYLTSYFARKGEERKGDAGRHAVRTVLPGVCPERVLRTWQRVGELHKQGP